MGGELLGNDTVVVHVELPCCRMLSTSAASQCRSPGQLTNLSLVSPLQFANSKRQLPTGETVETGSITVSQVGNRATMPAFSKQLLHRFYLAVLVAGTVCAAGLCSACT